MVLPRDQRLAPSPTSWRRRAAARPVDVGVGLALPRRAIGPPTKGTASRPPTQRVVTGELVQVMLAKRRCSLAVHGVFNHLGCFVGEAARVHARLGSVKELQDAS
jgi:hypothetical protein